MPGEPVGRARWSRAFPPSRVTAGLGFLVGFWPALLSAEPVCFEARLVGPPLEREPQAALRLTWQNPTPGDTAAIRRVAASVPGTLSVDLPRAGLWQVEVESAQLWSEAQWVRAGAASSTPSPCVVLKLFPLAQVTGHVAGPSLPDGDFAVRFSGSPAVAAAVRVPRGEARCRVARDRRFSCSVPAGQVDLRLSARGFVPAYFWDRPLAAGKPNALGALSLTKGASVVGWVELAKGEKVPGSTKLELSPEIDGGDEGAWEKARRQTSQVAATARGFFQFPTVVPGRYRLLARHPDFTAPRVFPIEVRRDLETEITQPLQLSPPTTMTASIEPRSTPDGTPWAVRLEPRAEGSFLPSQDVFTGEEAEPGLWRFTGLAAGPYQLFVEAKDDARWWQGPVDVKPGMEPLSIEIQLVPVRGQISLGTEPLAARLMFGGLTGRDRRMPFIADEKGHFEGALPSEGQWRVDLVSTDPYLRMSLPQVEVRRRPGKSYAEVEIRLPDTRLKGLVVDEKDNPISQAQVSVHSVGERAEQVRTDAKGKFDLRGLKPGAAAVRAEAEERSSEWVQTALREGDREGTSLRLVARKKARLNGRVMAAGQPAPGARLLVWPDWTAGVAAPILTGAEAMSGSEGEFSVSLPAGLSAVNVLAMAPGLPLQMRRIPLEPGAGIEIQLAAAGGTLVVENAEGPLGAYSLVHGGTHVSLAGPLEDWRRRNPDTVGGPGLWSLPLLEPGEYVLCNNRLARAALDQGVPPPEGACVAGLLGPHGELTLALPGPPQASAAAKASVAPKNSPRLHTVGRQRSKTER